MAFKVNWIHGALAVSLAANIFAGGYLVGKEMRPDGQKREHRMNSRELFNMRHLMSYLPEDRREELKAMMRNHRKDLRAGFRGIRESEEKVRALLLADTVDKAALRGALDELEGKTRQLHGPLRAVLLDIVADLDLETRKQLAEDMYKRRQARMKRGPERDPGGPFGDETGRVPPPPPGGFGGEGPDGMRERPDDDGRDGQPEREPDASF
ncbi:periplasmic heavy metal sensor [Kordiimonas sp.]|uniref:periplasmic heavy metal sensor n=1 Tax=Kordiimonas sp. TaxID=1970157 RepID=UPI003A8E717C